MNSCLGQVLSRARGWRTKLVGVDSTALKTVSVICLNFERMITCSLRYSFIRYSFINCESTCSACCFYFCFSSPKRASDIPKTAGIKTLLLLFTVRLATNVFLIPPTFDHQLNDSYHIIWFVIRFFSAVLQKTMRLAVHRRQWHGIQYHQDQECCR